jgi:hypothetical protein
MNAQHHYQILLRRGMSLLTGIAQGHYRNADRRITQIEELQSFITKKELNSPGIRNVKMHSTPSEQISLLPQFWLNRMFPNLLTSIVMLRESDFVVCLCKTTE